LTKNEAKFDSHEDEEEEEDRLNDEDDEDEKAKREEEEQEDDDIYSDDMSAFPKPRRSLKQIRFIFFPKRSIHATFCNLLTLPTSTHSTT
jgi:hypothetical protein